MLGIRICWIRLFLGHSDPLVRGMDPEPYPSLADWNNAYKIKFYHKTFANNLIFKTEDNVLAGS